MKTKYYKKRKGRLRNVKRMKYIKIFLKKEKKNRKSAPARCQNVSEEEASIL